MKTSFRAGARRRRSRSAASACADGDLQRTAPRRRSTASRRELGHGAVVIAAITSCTNTSNPSVMLAAGLLAQKAVATRADGAAAT